MKLQYLIESGEEAFDSNIPAHEHFEKLIQLRDVLQHQFRQLTRRANKLFAEKKAYDADTWYNLTHAGFSQPAQFKEDDFVRYTTGPSDLGSAIDFYVKQGQPTNEVEALVARINNLHREFTELFSSKIQKLKPTAVDSYIETHRAATEQANLPDEQNGEPIVYYGEDGKKHYLHNPVKFYGEPHYAGTIQHYDWPSKKLKEAYFSIQRLLRQNELKPLTKVYSGKEDGETHFIACNEDHSVVWQFDGVRDYVFLAGNAEHPSKKILQSQDEGRLHPTTVELLKNTFKTLSKIKPPELP